MKKRNLFLDNYKGILILLVVFAHFLYEYYLNNNNILINNIITFIYTFHMANFIYISGYLSKSDNSTNKKSLIKLLLYYIFFNTLMMIFLYITAGNKINLIKPYNSYWYILSLFTWRLCIKKLEKIKGIIPISIIIALIIGYIPGINNILSITRTIAFFPFFLLGYKYSKEKMNNFIKQRKKQHYFIGITFLIICSFIIKLFIKSNNLTELTLVMNSYQNKIDIIYRIFLFFISIMTICIFKLIIPNKKIPLLTHIGQNSLIIYLIHRFITIIFTWIFPKVYCNNKYIVYALIATIITTIILSSEKINIYISNFFETMTNNIIKNKKTVKWFILLFIITIIFYNIHKHNKNEIYINTTKTNIISKELKNDLDNSITISYVGDLILLKDQITSEYNKETNTYDFSKMFEYATPYLKKADLAVAVLEGPLAGKNTPYSTSNFDDGIKLYLNFPDEFAEAIKNSGIDLVTTANNHLLDAKLQGAYKTLDTLDKLEIKHTGSYRNQEEKNKNDVMIIDVKGIKIAVLSYLNSINNHEIDNVYKENSYITSYIPNTNDYFHDKMYEEIKDDFKEAKNSNVDLIMVLAHIGTQFSHETDELQNKWNRIFSSLGANIILNDHAHAVQPIENINDTLIVNCPGNFANSYTEYDGDATSIVNIHINKDNKKIIGSSIIPMYTQEYKENSYRALPIYDIYNNQKLYNELTNKDLQRIQETQKIITNVMLRKTINIDNIKEKYFFINNNYYIEDNNFLEEIDNYENNKLYKLLNQSNSITFIGDSITEGTKNDYYPWYEPLINEFNQKTIKNISKGGYTTKLIYNEYKKQILNSNSDLYFIALGTNDIRYRDKKICSMTQTEYIEYIDKIIKLIKKSNNSAKIILISPWTSLENDTISKLNHDEKTKMINAYSIELKKYAEKNLYNYIDPNNYIIEFLNKNDTSKYMVDFIHPNSTLGIKLYSQAVLNSFK